MVTDMKNPKHKYYFPCGQWLAKDEGDKLICRDLPGSRDPLASRRRMYFCDLLLLIVSYCTKVNFVMV